MPLEPGDVGVVEEKPGHGLDGTQDGDRATCTEAVMRLWREYGEPVVPCRGRVQVRGTDRTGRNDFTVGHP